MQISKNKDSQSMPDWAERLPDLEPLFRAHAELCKAMASPQRQAILHMLCNEERCVGDIAAALGLTPQNVSQHLRLLKERRLVRSRKDGQTVYYMITNHKFIEACTLIRQALIEQHQADGGLVRAAELVDALEQPEPTSPSA
jgi:ArsR family transcriptional regulator, virulence genes transcriptional regulator